MGLILEGTVQNTVKNLDNEQKKILIGKEEIENHIGNLHIGHSLVANIYLGCQTIPNHYQQYLVPRE